MSAHYPRTPVQPALPPNPQLPDNRWRAAWSRQDFLALGPYETAPGSARGHLANLLAEWGLRQLRDDCELIASELVTNSVRAVRAGRWAELPSVRMWTLGAPSQVMLLVWDALRHLPQPKAAGQDDESGRGLLLVGQLSTRWGSYLPPAHYEPDHHGGKVTWAIIGTIKKGQ